ncbi:MAG: serine hydrolase [Maribacter sp.]
MNSKTHFFFLFFVATTLIGVFAQSEERFKGIETELNEILKVTNSPGFAVAVIDSLGIIYSKGFGYRDWENKISMNANTLLPIGSTTKAFTCALLGQLRAEGKLSFEDSPIKHIPELSFYTAALNENITIKDLMTHQTGIPRHDESWSLFPSQSKDSLILRMRYHEPFKGLRQQWHYSNFMFMAQGVLGERLTGKNWEQNIKERFFEPLDMQRSTTSISALKKRSNVAIGYELRQDKFIKKVAYFDLAGMGPAGSINSSVNEMARWMTVWLNEGRYGGKQILPEVYVEEAMSSQAVTSPSLPDEEFPDMHFSTYGYGWFISSYRGHYRLQHEGNIDGFSANVSFFPSDGLGIVVLTNLSGSSLTSMVRNTIADRMLGTERTDWVNDFRLSWERARKEFKRSKEVSITEENTNDSTLFSIGKFTGSYENKGYGRFKIVQEKDSLLARFKLKKYYLKHIGNAIFKALERTDSGVLESDLPSFEFQFIPGVEEEPIGIHIKLEAFLEKPIIFKKNQ